MTLIAFACKGDHAEIVTDTGAWRGNARNMSQVTKVLPLHHLAAVFTSAGSIDFKQRAYYYLVHLSTEVTTFDELVEAAASCLNLAWTEVQEEFEVQLGHTPLAFLIGYSPAAGRFAAYVMSPDHDFQPRLVTERVYSTPTPWTAKPPEAELNRVMDHLEKAAEGRPDRLESIARMRETWPTRPELSTPETLTDWIMLALRVREERSLSGPHGRVLIGGDILHHRLTRDTYTVHNAWTLDEEGEDSEDFKRMVAYSHHPAVQLGPCACGSGDAGIDCCLSADLEEPCGCGTGKLFWECCVVERPA